MAKKKKAARRADSQVDVEEPEVEEEDEDEEELVEAGPLEAEDKFLRYLISVWGERKGRERFEAGEEF